MKKILCLILSVVLTFAMVSALAETEVNLGEKRNVAFTKAGDNSVDVGISPTTGLPLAGYEIPEGFGGQAVTGRYLPVLVQIDNFEGGAGNRGPVYGSYSDVVYEGPIHENGETRFTYLFSDLYPTYVGPNRSARLQHLWLREEWSGAFVYYGTQPYERTNVENEIARLGIRKLGLLYDGTYGAKAWSPYQLRSEILKQTHNALWRLADLMANVPPQDYVPSVNHTFKFTDAKPEGGDTAETVYVNWARNGEMNSMLEYDAEQNCYYRYIMTDPKNPQEYKEILPAIKSNDKIEQGRSITFNNVIVQCLEMEYHTVDAPLPTVLGTGNAEYFIGGKHFSGVWNRDTLQERTVFYNADGSEIELQRGRTLIIMFDYAIKGRSVSYE